MDNEQISTRGGFSSTLGFILSSAGASIGLGNLWKFPYIVGIHGGGLFIILYIVLAVLLGIPLILCEMSIGRSTQLGPSAAFKSLNKKWTFAGSLGVLGSFVTMCYYTVVGGWVIKYMTSYIFNTDFIHNSEKNFSSFISNPVEPAIYTVIFIILCTFIVLKGIANGIEKASKIMLPILFLFLIILAVRALFLPNAIKGINFLFGPDFSAVNSVQNLLITLSSVISQIFFSVSIGMGITITYGSYIHKNENLQKSAVLVVILDTLVAILSGIVIFPAVFSFGFEPTSGPGLVFQILPKIFDSIAFGHILGTIFFILVFFAAITSAIASFEVVSVFFMDSLGFKRHQSVIVITLVICIFAVIVSLSNSILSGFTIINMNLFDLSVFLTDKILIPLTSLLTCIFVGYIIKPYVFIKEIEKGSSKLKTKKLFEIIIKYIAPIIITIILIIGFIQ